MNKNLKRSDSLKTLVNQRKSLMSIRTLVKPSSAKPNSARSSLSSPISYTEKDEQELYRKKYLEQKEKEKSLLGAIKRIISYIETKNVQVEKPYKKAKKEKKSKK